MDSGVYAMCLREWRVNGAVRGQHLRPTPNPNGEAVRVRFVGVGRMSVPPLAIRVSWALWVLIAVAWTSLHNLIRLKATPGPWSRGPNPPCAARPPSHPLTLPPLSPSISRSILRTPSRTLNVTSRTASSSPRSSLVTLPRASTCTATTTARRSGSRRTTGGS